MPKLLLKALGLLLLLLLAQQGAVDHELSHFSSFNVAGIDVGPSGTTDAPCALCPAFAQVVTPAFSHSFHIPLLVRFALVVVPKPRYAAIDAAVPRPRSRGPPSLS
jgi:hypothetical protein